EDGHTRLPSEQSAVSEPFATESQQEDDDESEDIILTSLPLEDETAANTDLSEADYVVTDSRDNALPLASDPQAGSEEALFNAVIDELDLAAQDLPTELTDAEQEDNLPLLLVEESLDEDSDLDD